MKRKKWREKVKERRVREDRKKGQDAEWKRRE